MNNVLLGMLVVTAASPVLLVYQVTRMAHSRYRNKLWEIRDDLYDDLRLGRIQRSDGAEIFFNVFERQIRSAGKVSFSDVVLAVKVIGPQQDGMLIDQVLSQVDLPEDRKAIEGYFLALETATRRYLAWGSPSGWVGSAYFGLKGWARRQGLRYVDARQRRIEEAIKARTLVDEGRKRQRHYQEALRARQESIRAAQKQARARQAVVEQFTMNEMASIAPKSGLATIERSPGEVPC